MRASNNNGFLDQGINHSHTMRQLERPGFGYWLLYGLGWLLGKVVQLLWLIRVTIVWVLVWTYAAVTDNGWLTGLSVVILVALLIGGGYSRSCRRLLPVVGDASSLLQARARMNRIRAGNELLNHVGIEAGVDGTTNGNVVLVHDRDGNQVLKVLEGIPRVPNKKIVAALEEFKDAIGAVRVHGEPLNSGVRVTLYENDPLDEPVTITKPASLEPDKMLVECARGVSGESLPIRFGNNSGMVVGGVPGSGKTAGVTSFLLPLALSEYVNLSIIDGKGGEDWTSYEAVADTYIRGDEELEPIAEYVESLVATMYDRLNNQKQNLGVSNFWGASAADRLAAGERLELLVIDECQGVFEQTGRDKDEKLIIGRITRAVSTLVKRGRSAGMFVILMTQKPTTESLPSAIRDNCGVKVAFRVETGAAETAIVGEIPDDINVPRATRIPSGRPGGAVMAVEGGGRAECRFFYMDEARQSELLSRSPKARNDVADMNPVNELNAEPETGSASMNDDSPENADEPDNHSESNSDNA